MAKDSDFYRQLLERYLAGNCNQAEAGDLLDFIAREPALAREILNESSGETIDRYIRQDDDLDPAISERMHRKLMDTIAKDTKPFRVFRGEDHGASEALFREYFRPLCFFAESFTGDRAEAEDIVADIFVKMLQGRRSFENLSNVKAFLYTATKNACINHYKAGKRHQNAHKQIEYQLKNGVEDIAAFDEEIIRAEVISEIHREIEELPNRCREIFKLIFMEGLSTDQIGERMGIATQTVRTQKARAIQLLKTQFLRKAS